MCSLDIRRENLRPKLACKSVQQFKQVEFFGRAQHGVNSGISAISLALVGHNSDNATKAFGESSVPADNLMTLFVRVRGNGTRIDDKNVRTIVELHLLKSFSSNFREIVEVSE